MAQVSGARRPADSRGGRASHRRAPPSNSTTLLAVCWVVGRPLRRAPPRRSDRCSLSVGWEEIAQGAAPGANPSSRCATRGGEGRASAASAVWGRREGRTERGTGRTEDGETERGTGSPFQLNDITDLIGRPAKLHLGPIKSRGAIDRKSADALRSRVPRSATPAHRSYAWSTDRLRLGTCIEIQRQLRRFACATVHSGPGDLESLRELRPARAFTATSAC